MENLPELRREMRAYEDHRACKLASIVLALTSDSTPAADRDTVAAEWINQYPYHALQTGQRSAANQVRKGIRPLKIAGIVSADALEIRVISRLLLTMSAGNKGIVVADGGWPVPTHEWTSWPTVPRHLLEVQDMILRQRLANAASQGS